MNYTDTAIMDIKEGIIVHQVNCQNAIGAGISGVICNKYPIVKEAYHYAFTQMPKEKIFGTWQPVTVNENLIVVNMFTQFNYGNPKKTGKVYTDINKLITCLDDIIKKNPDKKVYISEFIGCGFGGANWEELLSLLETLNINICKQPTYIAKTYQSCH